jgi:hypothetical protein
MKNRPIDADTMRKRALYDRRGLLITSLCDYSIRHSHRRTDAYDVLHNGKVVCSGGRVAVGRFMASLLT